MKKRTSCLQTGILWLIKLACLGAFIVAAIFVVMSVWPSIGAKGSDLLRSVIGDAAVAKLETAYFGVNDHIQTWKYNLGLAKPAVPWAGSTSSAPAAKSTSVAVNAPAQEANPGTSPASAWQLESLKPLGTLNGEGLWSAYIQNAAGKTVAFRTFLQPDPGRPYAVVAVVAFDLTQTRLHFVLGIDEPFAPNTPKRSGAMPEADKAHGELLAMFNGGFKGRHGHFGAMANGIVAIPPSNGLGTLAIYNKGTLALGEWGKDILPSADMLAWRQNGPLVIQKGQINPRINDNSPQDWGYTVDTVAPTWRSGVGLSADGKILYYFCGPSLSMEALSKSMQAARVDNAIQLDINTFWVHFVAVHPDGSLEALFPDMMKEDIGRYLYPYTRDFFYMTKLP
jgi:uncharacterized membrane protein